MLLLKCYVRVRARVPLRHKIFIMPLAYSNQSSNNIFKNKYSFEIYHLQTEHCTSFIKRKVLYPIPTVPTAPFVVG